MDKEGENLTNIKLAGYNTLNADKQNELLYLFYKAGFQQCFGKSTERALVAHAIWASIDVP